MSSKTSEAFSSEASDAELEAWWEQFLAKKKTEDAQDEDVRLAWETCAQRKLKFIREVRLLTDLYQPIKKKVAEILSSDHDRRGDRLYQEWCKVRRKECLLAYYDNQTFRAIYANYRFLSSATSFLQVRLWCSCVLTIRKFIGSGRENNSWAPRRRGISSRPRPKGD